MKNKRLIIIGILILAIPSLEVVVDFADMLRIDIYECNPPSLFIYF